MEIVSRDYFLCYSKEKRPINLLKFIFQHLIKKGEKFWIIECSRNRWRVKCIRRKKWFSHQKLFNVLWHVEYVSTARYFLNNHFGSSNLGNLSKFSISGDFRGFLGRFWAILINLLDLMISTLGFQQNFRNWMPWRTVVLYVVGLNENIWLKKP